MVHWTLSGIKPDKPVPESKFRHLLDFLVQNDDNTGRWVGGWMCVLDEMASNVSEHWMNIAAVNFSQTSLFLKLFCRGPKKST